MITRNEHRTPRDRTVPFVRMRYVSAFDPIRVSDSARHCGRARLGRSAGSADAEFLYAAHPQWPDVDAFGIPDRHEHADCDADQDGDSDSNCYTIAIADGGYANVAAT